MLNMLVKKLNQRKQLQLHALLLQTIANLCADTGSSCIFCTSDASCLLLFLSASLLPLLVPYLSSTCPPYLSPLLVHALVSYLSPTCPLPVPYLSPSCPLLVPGLVPTCPCSCPRCLSPTLLGSAFFRAAFLLQRRNELAPWLFIEHQNSSSHVHPLSSPGSW